MPHSAAPQHYLPARYYVQLCLRLAEWGLDIPALLTDAGVNPAVLQMADGQLTVAQVEALAPLAVLRSGRTDLGFELGKLL